MSYLSEEQYRKILAELSRIPGNYGDHVEQAVKWDADKISEMNRRLLNETPSAKNAAAFFNWWRFVFQISTHLTPPQTGEIVISLKEFQIATAFGLSFDFGGTWRPIPFELWADIAPSLMEQVRAFVNSHYEKWSTFSEAHLDLTQVERKRDELKTNPATAPIYKRWKDAWSGYF